MAQEIRKIACIGEVMIELVSHGDTADLNVAGDTYNTAVYLARLLRESNAEVTYLTALGVDDFSDRILDQMKAQDIGTGYIERRTNKVPGLYAIKTDDMGERSFTYWRSDSAARTLFSEPCDISFDSLLDFDLILLSAITVAILPDSVRQSLIAALDKYRANGGLVVYDSNHRPHLWEDSETAIRVNTEIWKRCDIGLPSVDDEMALYGDASHYEVLERLASFGVVHGALKRGEEGPIALSQEKCDVEFTPVTTVIDSTAAGDSFNAGFLAAMVKGQSEAEALLSGHDMAAEVIQHRGAIIPIELQKKW